MLELRRPGKYVLGIFAIASALFIAVEVSMVVGLILGGVAVLVLPWVPVHSGTGSDGSDG